MNLKVLAMMAMALALTGCVTRDDPVLFTGSVAPVAPTLTADVAPTYATAYLPQVAGNVRAVRQSSAPDKIFQTILYASPGYGDGENALTVSVAPRSSDPTYFQAPSAREIARDLRAAFPDVAMRISSAAGQNLSGPFGYATGKRADGGACIFAWQTARDIGRADRTGFARMRDPHYAAKVRLRYCHPDLSEGALISLMSGLRIREVTPTTVEMLRFAEGSGVAAQAAPATATVQARPVTAPVAPKQASRTARPEPESTLPVRSAPRVLKPGELAGYAGTQTAKAEVSDRAETTLVAAAAVPLPESLGQ